MQTLVIHSMKKGTKQGTTNTQLASIIFVNILYQTIPWGVKLLIKHVNLVSGGFA